MHFLLMGEGASDLGSENNPGPLIVPLERLARDITGKEEEGFPYGYVRKTQVENAAKSFEREQSRKKILLRGKKRKFATLASFERMATGLGLVALSSGKNTGAVFFHDCDYTRSEVSPSDKYYEQLVCSIERGFEQARFQCGVPMVPKPRSESWFLCHYQKHPYRNCRRFEDLPANDAARNSGKKKLAEFLGCPENQIYQKIEPEKVDWSRIDAPSFLFFKKRFQHVVERLTNRPFTYPEQETLMSCQP